MNIHFAKYIRSWSGILNAFINYLNINMRTTRIKRNVRASRNLCTSSSNSCHSIAFMVKSSFVLGWCLKRDTPPGRILQSRRPTPTDITTLGLLFYSSWRLLLGLLCKRYNGSITCHWLLIHGVLSEYLYSSQSRRYGFQGLRDMLQAKHKCSSNARKQSSSKFFCPVLQRPLFILYRISSSYVRATSKTEAFAAPSSMKLQLQRRRRRRWKPR